MIVQQDFWKTSKESELEAMKEELERVRKSNDKVRRGMFARHNELAKQYLEMREEFENWKRSVCRG